MVFRDLLHTLGNNVTIPAQPEKCIVAHLNWLLNSRRDRHPHLPGYGMPDLHSFLTKPDPETAVATEIRKVIELYEPRLARVRVLPEPGHEGSFNERFHVRFIIEAVLAGEGDRLEFHETAEISREGNVKLR